MLAVFVADTVNTMFDIWYIYEAVITHFGEFYLMEKIEKDLIQFWL